MLSLQWTSLKENSLLLAQGIQRVAEKKIDDLIGTTKSALDMDEFTWSGIQQRLFRLPEKSRFIVQKVRLIAQGVVKHVRNIIADHKADAFDNIN